MKIIKTSNNKHITTPWMSPDEAATYCGVSRSTFDRWQKIIELPYAGDKNNRRYLEETISGWLQKLSKRIDIDCEVADDE
jgi:predicted site-specific integrase-resolvase